MGPLEVVFVLASLVVAPVETQAKADFKDCLKISKLVIEGDNVIVPLNTSEAMEVAKWNSTDSSWELVLLINNGKSHLLNSKFTDRFTVSQENFIVKNVSREAQGVYMVTLYLSGKCVSLINLTVQAPMEPPSVIPGNQAPVAHPAWWALLLILIIAAAAIIIAVQRFCPRKDGSSVSYTQSSGEEKRTRRLQDGEGEKINTAAAGEGKDQENPEA